MAAQTGWGKQSGVHVCLGGVSMGNGGLLRLFSRAVSQRVMMLLGCFVNDG